MWKLNNLNHGPGPARKPSVNTQLFLNTYIAQSCTVHGNRQASTCAAFSGIGK